MDRERDRKRRRREREEGKRKRRKRATLGGVGSGAGDSLSPYLSLSFGLVCARPLSSFEVHERLRPSGRRRAGYSLPFLLSMGRALISTRALCAPPPLTLLLLLCCCSPRIRSPVHDVTNSSSSFSSRCLYACTRPRPRQER